MPESLGRTHARSRMFASLHYANYRLLWMGNLVSQSGDWMDQLAFNWLVLSLTGSPFFLGLVNFCRAVPILLFTLVGGAAADRFERRRLMMVTQSFAMLLAFLLAVLVTSGLINIWLILAIAALRGTMMSFNLPARQSLISDLVPEDDLPNAIALNSTTMNFTRIIGPSIAGLLIVAVGVAGCFYLNALSFLAVLWTLNAMTFPVKPRKAATRKVRGSLTDGFRYIASDRTLLLLVGIATVPMFFGQPYMTMLAAFAYDVLSVGPAGLGIMTSAVGVGAVIGGLTLASLGKSAPRGLIMLGGMATFGFLLTLFCYSSWMPLSVLLLMGAGAMNICYNASNNTLLQMRVPNEYRGRVLSTMYLNRSLVPLGTSLAGTLSVLVGVRAAVASMAGVVLVIGVLGMLMVPSLRKLS
ncbi:MAG TPA: MFS transporter [Chloroflexota bacterium]|nr:MFS transporter [Chloroflexota bacterium]